MYDTINFKLTILEAQHTDFINELPQRLDNVAYHNYDGDEVITGNIGGLKVSVNRYQVKVKDGSLCKWYLGDNLKGLTRGDVQRAIEKLSDTLHLPMNRANVTRLDIAENIICRYPVGVYLNHLGVLRYFDRLQEPNGLYYGKKVERLCFYDKNKEQKTKGEVIPELYQNRNVLRYEQRYTRRLPFVLGVPVVDGALLYDEKFYIGIINRWRDTYRSIDKINNITLNFQAMTSKQQLYKMGVLSLIERVGGEVEFIDQINEAQKRGDLTPKQAFDLRQTVKDVVKIEEGLTVKSDAIEELDKKILEVVKFYR